MDNPKLYHETNQLQRQNAAEVIREYSSKFLCHPKGLANLIDVGSATGDVLMDIVHPLLNKQFHRIVCSDLNPKMMEYAKSNYEEKVKNSEFRVLDIASEAELSPNLKGQFDLVLSFYCLQLIQNQRRAFHNIYSLLRPEGGDCLLTLFARSPYYDAYQSLSKTAKWSPYLWDVNKFTCCWHYAKDPVQQVRQLLEECGFCDIEVKLQPKIYTYESFKIFKYNMKAICHYTHRIPYSMHDELIEDFVEAMISVNSDFKYFDDQWQKFRFPYVQMLIYARKGASV